MTHAEELKANREAKAKCLWEQKKCFQDIAPKKRNKFIKAFADSSFGSPRKPHGLDWTHRNGYQIDGIGYIIEAIKGDYESWYKIMLIDNPLEDWSDWEILAELGMEAYYRAPGYAFRHKASIYRSKYSVMLVQHGGIDI